MSERILKALMQLFSIISEVDVEGVAKDRRNVVQLFLRQQLNKELVEEYLQVYDQFLESQEKKGTDIKKKKRTAVSSVKVLRICTQINEELAQKQKIVVLIRLIEFISSGGQPSAQELEFVTTVAETFNIAKDEFTRCISFVRSREDEAPDPHSVLVIDGDHTFSNPDIKYIFSENMSGHVRVLHIQSVNMYVLRYYGKGELYLNGQIIHENRIYVLTQGSSLRGSRISPIYYSDIVSSFLRDTTRRKILFTTRDLEYRFKAGNIGLHPLNFLEESGNMIGIMGGSGAGKSTLLNVLNGVEQPSGGNILINGIDIHREKEKIEGVIGFVPQDDLLMDDLTVFQNLFYAAKLCFGEHTDEQIAKMCLELLTDIGLYEARNLKVGSPLEKVISGGQRKRLNIALELIREPSVLFLDEPTSGLSSRDSENIMDLLKELTLKGKLVFVVIHQPSSEIFKMFDRLIILDVGGYPIYYGNPVDAVIYFKTLIQHVNPNESECIHCGNVNPEQIFNIIESKIVDEYGNLTRTRKISPRQWNEFYREKCEYKFNGAPPVTPAGPQPEAAPERTLRIPGKLKQFLVFITRDVLAKLANKQYMYINLLEAPVLALILAWVVRYFNPDVSKAGYVFYENENIPIYMFMAIVVAMFIGLTVSAEEIIKDRKILKREAFLNLSRGSYLFSKIAIMFVMSAIQTITFILLGNWILDIKGMTLAYWAVLFSTACVSNLIGLNISSAFNSAVTIYILIPFILIPHLLLSGVMVKFEKLNPTIIVYNSVPVVGEMMVTRWAYEALSVYQFKENPHEKRFYDYDKIKSIADFRKNYWLPQLRNKVDQCLNNYPQVKRSPEIRTRYENDLALIRGELAKVTKDMKFSRFVQGAQEAFTLDSLTPENFTPSVAVKVKSMMESVGNWYMQVYNKMSSDKDRLISRMISTPAGREQFDSEKNRYTNEALTDLVVNKKEFNKIIEVDGQLIQQADPIFLDPPKSQFLRAHFFAPRKSFLVRYFDTFWINLGVIWLMVVLWSIALYYELFRKALQYSGDFFAAAGKIMQAKRSGKQPDKKESPG